MSRTSNLPLRIALIVALASTTTTAQNGVLASLSSDIVRLLISGDQGPFRVILRGDVGRILEAAERDGLRVHRILDGFVAATATAVQLEALRSIPGVEAISRDLRVAPMMSVSIAAMGGDRARAAAPGTLLGLGALPAVSGRGVGVAVVDSGIAPHPALAGKVVAAVSFVSGESADTMDWFGHGTHIAGTIAGQPTPANGRDSGFSGGVAPGAHLVNVRVLGREGIGLTSDVIAGIQWVVVNRQRLGIRVINLSLGHPVVESCATDPLCTAVERASLAGLVVVASAGNGGKDRDGKELLASITSPGNAPQAITVGALNTWGTVHRDDDTVTTYSSRGPTAFDLLIKPDVVAPGNKIVSLGVPGSYLAAHFPHQVSGSGAHSYYQMSGTSMATAMVSGGAALLLDGGPSLASRQVKLALQVTASFMPEAGLVRSGSGSVNLHAARRIQGVVQGLLSSVPSVTIGGRPIQPGGVLFPSSVPMVDLLAARAGLPVLGALDLMQIWANRTLARPAVLGAVNPAAGWPASKLVWGTLSPITDGQQIIWSDDASYGYQIIWSDRSRTEGNQIIWSDRNRTDGNQIIWSDRLPVPEN